MRRAAALTALCALLISASTSRGLGQSVPLIPVTVVLVATADGLPFYYAQQQGLFAKAGLDVTANYVTSGAIAATAVVGGAAEIGYSNLLSVITAHQRGIPFVLLAPGGQHDPASPNSEIFVERDSTVKTAKDLEGRTFAVVSLHDLQTLSTMAFLARGGADPTLVHFIEMPQSSMLEALEAKRVDAIVSYEPFRSAVEASGQARSLGAPYSAISKDMLYTAWVALGPWVEQHRDLVRRFARVMRAASAYTNPHYAQLLPLLASVTKLPPDSIAHSHRVHDATALSRGFIQPVIDTAARFHEIPAPFPAQDLIAAGL